jgi:sugar phosphate isomerase/epimerase
MIASIKQRQSDLSGLCIHTMTTKPWSIEEAIEKYAEAGIGGITVWRNVFKERSAQEVSQLLQQSGLTPVSLCRGGFFPRASSKGRQRAIADTKQAIDETAAIGAPLLVIVSGADPTQSLEQSRLQIMEGLAAVLPHAEQAGIKLAIEPLHPMYADDRSAINTLKQANDICEHFQSDWLGVAIDIYHVWWDSDLKEEIDRCGRNGSIFAFHISDWKTPTEDLLLDRGLMGEGCVPIREIRGWVEDAGFTGFHEVEIFSRTYWESEQDWFLAKIVQAYLEYC